MILRRRCCQLFVVVRSDEAKWVGCVQLHSEKSVFLARSVPAAHHEGIATRLVGSDLLQRFE